MTTNDMPGNGPESNFPIVSAGAIGGTTIQTVNARDLHTFLENGSQFSDWIKDRIAQFDFVENQDFVTVSETTETVKNGKTYQSRRTDYHVSIDMAKELAMVDKSDKGKQARRYFIECERIAKAGPALPDLSDPAVLQSLILEQCSKRIEAERRATAAEATVATQAPKVEAFDRIAAAEGSMCVTDAAKDLQVRPKDLFNWMSEKRWIYQRPGKAGYPADPSLSEQWDHGGWRGPGTGDGDAANQAMIPASIASVFSRNPMASANCRTDRGLTIATGIPCCHSSPKGSFS